MPYRPRNPREALISTGEASLETGIAQSTITSWCRTGRLRCYVTSGGHYRVRLSDVKTFLGVHYEYYPDEDSEIEDEGEEDE